MIGYILFIVICIVLLIYAISQLGLNREPGSTLIMSNKEHGNNDLPKSSKTTTPKTSNTTNGITQTRNNHICDFSGYKSHAHVYENKVEIGSRTYDINEIESVYLSPSTISSRGYLQVVAHDERPIGSIDEAMKCNHVLFLEAFGQNEDATKLKQIILDQVKKNNRVKNRRLSQVVDKFGINKEDITRDGAALTDTGIVYDIYDSISTFNRWSIKNVKFIDYKDIDFFAKRGSLRREMSIRGGGLNLGGAIVGGFLFGGVGAVLGSRVGTEISTKTETIDDRFVFIRSNKITEDIVVAIGKDVEEFLIGLRKAIPEKEYSEEQGFSN